MREPTRPPTPASSSLRKVDEATRKQGERRNGRIYLTGLAFSLLGDSAMTLVAGIWVKALTGSNSAAALVSVCVYAPSLLGPLAGVFVDRAPLRAMLVATNVASAALVLPLLAVRHSGDVWLIYLVMAGYGLSAVLVDPAESALFTALFSDDLRPRVNGLRLTLQEGGKLVAPLGGAAIFAACGGGVVAALDAATFLVAAIAVVRLKMPPVRRRATAPLRWRHDLAVAVAHLRRTPQLRRIVVLAAAAMALSGVVGAAQYGLVAALHKSPSFLGVLSAALGAGSILAGVASGALLARFGELTVVLFGFFDAAVGSVLRATGEIVAAVAGSFVLGFALPWIVVIAISATQRLTPDQLQGRMAAILTFALFAPLPVAQALGAGLISVVDYRTLFLAAAAIQLAVAARAVAASRRGAGTEGPAAFDRKTERP